jgi:hypothetical protein
MARVLVTGSNRGIGAARVAEEDLHEVTRGMLAIAERLTLKETGRFCRVAGEGRAV